MRAAAWVVLVGLAALAAASGQLAVGLAIGGLKAAIVGAEYMELRHADRAHALGVAGAIVVLTLVLSALSA